MGKAEFERFTAAALLDPHLRTTMLGGGNISAFATRLGLTDDETRVIQSHVVEVFNLAEPSLRSVPWSASEMISTIIRKSRLTLRYY